MSSPVFAHSSAIYIFIGIGAGVLLGLPGLIWGLWSYQKTLSAVDALDRFNKPCAIMAMLFGLAYGILAGMDARSDWLMVLIAGGAMAVFAMAIGVISFFIGRFLGAAFQFGIRLFKTIIYG